MKERKAPRVAGGQTFPQLPPYTYQKVSPLWLPSTSDCLGCLLTPPAHAGLLLTMHFMEVRIHWTENEGVVLLDYIYSLVSGS